MTSCFGEYHEVLHDVSDDEEDADDDNEEEEAYDDDKQGNDSIFRFPFFLLRSFPNDIFF